MVTPYRRWKAPTGDELQERLKVAEEQNRELKLRIAAIEKSLKACDYILRPYVQRAGVDDE